MTTTRPDRVTVTNPGDVPAGVWAELVDAVSHVTADVGASHIELPAADAASWLWWFATPSAGRWRWDPRAVALLNRHAGHGDDLDAALVMDRVAQAEWPASFPTPHELGVRRELTPEQRRDVARMLRLGGGANFSVPGAGKTTMAYVTFAAMRATGPIDRCLVVAPLSAHEAWATEPADVFDGGHQPWVAIRPDLPDGDVVVVNYEQLDSIGRRDVLLRWCRAARTLVIFDEAHRAKAGAAGIRGAAARELAAAASRRIVLTGTPRPNSAQDLVNVLELAYPGRGAALANGRPVPLNRAFVRVTKSELRLPPLVAAIERVPMSAAHDRVYDAMTDAAARAYIRDPRLAQDVTRAGRIAMLLLQAVTDPTAVLDTPGELAVIADRAEIDLETLLRELPASFTPTKFVRAAQLVAAHREAGTKVVLWACFRHHVDRLRVLLAPWQPAVVSGDVAVNDPNAATDRVREIARFRNDPNCTVLVATPHTLSEGVSLHRTTTHQIHLDRPYNAGIFLQSLDRTHRLGLPEEAYCTARFLHAARSDGAVTIDDVVAARLDRKVTEMGRVLDDPNLENLALPDLDDRLSDSDVLLGDDRAGDLAELFAHLAGSRR